MITEHKRGYLLGRSYRDSSVSNLLSGSYDLVIIASSWDRRCVCITDCRDLRARLGIYLLFESRDSHGLRDEHDQKLDSFLKMCCDRRKINQIYGHSLDVDGMWTKLYNEIKFAAEQVGHPLKVLLDLSTFPRYYALATLGTCIRHGISETVTIFYAEGIYEKPGQEDEETSEYQFTKGRWRTVTIPSLEGMCDPGKKKYFLVSVGFEGLKIMRTISREDPDRISILFPDPGVLGDYVQIAENANKPLVEQFKIPEEQIVRVAAGDAIGAWKSLEESSLERPEMENTHYLSCGTKPHAVGLALRAISIDHPTVLYNIPEGHPFMNIRPAGVFWRYDIKDLSCLPTDRVNTDYE